MKRGQMFRTKSNLIIGPLVIERHIHKLQVLPGDYEDTIDIPKVSYQLLIRAGEE